MGIPGTSFPEISKSERSLLWPQRVFMSDQTIFPMIAYENAAAAMDRLVRAFGFTERRRMTDQQGRVVHGELELSESIVMVASPTPDYRGPKSHAESCEQARRWSAVPWVIDGV